MHNLKIAFQTIIVLVLLYFIVKELINLYKDRQKINEKLNNNCIETDDLRIQTMFHRSFLIDFGDNYQFAKFKFSEDEAYLFLRNNWPKTHNGPFAIKFKLDSNYSYLSKYYITNLEILGTELTINFKHKYFIGVKYSLSITEVSTTDMEKIKSHLK